MEDPSTVIPPLVRRCPACGHVAWSRRFEPVDAGDGDDARTLVACPACARPFEPADTPWLN